MARDFWHPKAPNLVGKNVIVTIKPEDIMLSKSADSSLTSASGNSVEGVITEMVQMRSNAQVNDRRGLFSKNKALIKLD